MARRSTGPRFWESKNGWYCTVNGVRHLLVRGGRDREAEALVRWKVVTGALPAVSDDEKRDLIRLGMLIQGAAFVPWLRVLDDVNREREPEGLGDVLDVLLFRYCERPGFVADRMYRECRTLAEGTAFLVDRVGVRPGDGFDCFGPLAKLRALYVDFRNR
jgi:hypothetical protein